jgi:hypothetical protein
MGGKVLAVQKEKGEIFGSLVGRVPEQVGLGLVVLFVPTMIWIGYEPFEVTIGTRALQDDLIILFAKISQPAFQTPVLVALQIPTLTSRVATVPP